LFGGADFLLVRPTWSEAIAFARGSQMPPTTSYNTVGEPISFDYDASLRAFIGWRSPHGPGEIRFTYWNLQGTTDNSGTVSGPFQFIVDPYGAIVGSVIVIDPSDPRVGTPVMGGDRIDTHTWVEVNVYDIMFGSEVPLGDTCWAFAWNVGARIADVDQYYESVVSAGGFRATSGVFSVDFVGAGPRLGGELRRTGRFVSFYMNTHGSLLVGDYNVASTVNQLLPTPFTATTENPTTRTIPVVETELGVHWQATPRTLLSAGWLFQTWFDLGTSGGTFGGFFSGADDANLMSFDGLFLRGEVSF
jgi:hypothetical protein